MPLAVRLLGPVEVLVDGKPAELAGPRQLALVAFLALRPKGMATVDALVDALWTDGLPSDPGNAIQHHVTRLRKVLGPEALAAQPEGYGLRGADVDALEFEALLRAARAAMREGDAARAAETTAAALALWRGRPQAGLSEADWTGAEQTRLDALRLDVVEERFEALLALGEHATLVADLRAALDESPFRERLWAQLMLALYRAGRQAEALEAFQQARRTLAEELGLEPGPDLQRLQAAILSQDPAIAPVPVARAPRGNLTASITSFVGREALLAEIERLLREHRLVTLAGPPGVGKSRVALEAAQSLAGAFDGGVWHVDLRTAETSTDVPRLTAGVVEAGSSSATGDPVRRVVQRLRDARALLVLDECERFSAEVGQLATAVLRHCPQVHILATGREVLRAAGEHRVQVEPLDDSEAVDLFLDRARAARPEFGSSAEEIQLVAETCRLVDGLPAAIELAAARVHVLGPRELHASVERRVQNIRPGERAADTDGFFESLAEWSYELLHADEKSVLHQLAVFRGGSDLESLFAMCDRLGLDEPTVTELLATLVEKSIVSVSFPAGVARYDLLTIVRAHVLGRMAESGELAATRRAHAEHFATVADGALTGLRGRDHRLWRARIARDSENFWSALGCADDVSDVVLAQRLGIGCAWYFIFTNRIADGRAFVEQCLEVGTCGTSARCVELLGHVAYFATIELDLDRAVAAGTEAVRLAAGLDAPRERAYAESELGHALGTAGHRREADALVAGARRTYEALGERWYVAGCDFIAAILAVRAGEVDAVASRAGSLAEQSRELGYDPWLALAMALQAWSAGRRGDHETEEHGYRDVLSAFPEDLLVSSLALAALAENALARGDPDGARALALRAVRTARQAPSPWLTAHARVALARAVAGAGDLPDAERLYEQVADWSEGRRTHERIELFFAPAVGSPGARALLALADLAEAADMEYALLLRARAAAIAAADRVPTA